MAKSAFREAETLVKDCDRDRQNHNNLVKKHDATRKVKFDNLETIERDIDTLQVCSLLFIIQY